MVDYPETANANIVESDGTYYPVRLNWLPRVGDSIKLYSFLDTASGHEPGHSYVVTSIEHDMHDVTEKCPDGKHFVSIHVNRK